MPTHVKFSRSHLIKCLPCILPQRPALCPGLYLTLHLNFITTLWKRYFAHVLNVRKRTHREIKYLALGSQTHNLQVTQAEFNNSELSAAKACIFSYWPLLCILSFTPRNLPGYCLPNQQWALALVWQKHFFQWLHSPWKQGLIFLCHTDDHHSIRHKVLNEMLRGSESRRETRTK